MTRFLLVDLVAPSLDLSNAELVATRAAGSRKFQLGMAKVTNGNGVISAIESRCFEGWIYVIEFYVQAALLAAEAAVSPRPEKDRFAHTRRELSAGPLLVCIRHLSCHRACAALYNSPPSAAADVSHAVIDNTRASKPPQASRPAAGRRC